MALFESLQRIERMIWPMLTRATVPQLYGLPLASCVIVCTLSTGSGTDYALAEVCVEDDRRRCCPYGGFPAVRI